MKVYGAIVPFLAALSFASFAKSFDDADPEGGSSHFIRARRRLPPAGAVAIDPASNLVALATGVGTFSVALSCEVDVKENKKKRMLSCSFEGAPGPYRANTSRKIDCYEAEIDKEGPDPTVTTLETTTTSMRIKDDGAGKVRCSFRK